MLSVSGKYWEEINVSKRIVDKVKNDNNFSEIISKIIISKKFDKEELNSINYDLEVSNPFLDNKDFKKGHSLLKESLKNKEKIVVVGDYDVDGCVSTSLIVNYFKLINKKGIINVGGPAQSVYNFAKKSNKKVKKKILEVKKNSLPLNSTMKITKFEKIS